MLVIPLPEHTQFDYVEITGPDAAQFLQGQLTCNLDLLSDQQGLTGALCNPKGRVIADFLMVLKQDGRILLQTSKGAASKIIDTLARYAVFSKVELVATAGPVAVYGLIGAQFDAALRECFPALPAQAYGVLSREDLTVIRIPGPTPRYQIWCCSEPAHTSLARLDVMEDRGSVARWIREDLAAGIIHVAENNSEKFTPQLLNYDISGVVDFEKGCYTGQEVVARMHYRSKAKKRLYRLSSKTEIRLDSVLVEPGQSSTAVADILCAVPAQTSAEDSLALAIVSTEIGDNSRDMINAGNQEPVTVHALSYDRL